MTKPYTPLLGKAVRRIARLRGGGSALPGLFIEKIDPDFVRDTLAQLPKGVIVVSGTNGKTTTTKMIVSLLKDQGLKVFTNRTGSNFIRGVAAALLEEVDNKGLIEADIAVLELDEAHAVHFVRTIKPRYSLLLNVMRDQLDRFGEIDHTASMLQVIAEATAETVVLNREDPRISRIASSVEHANVQYFGLDASVRKLFPNDDDLYGVDAPAAKHPHADVTLKHFDDDSATFTIDGKDHTLTMKLTGVYNIYNAAAALALVRSIMQDEINFDQLLRSLSEVTPAFGRGEVLTVEGQPLEIVLVKNPSGFRLGLQSFDPKDYATMIAINDNYADGRDMSWLWDVDFDSLRAGGVAAISGVRAYDMALRMQYDEIDVSYIDPSLTKTLHRFITANHDMPKRIYCTYTAMLALRRELAKLTDVEKVL